MDPSSFEKKPNAPRKVKYKPKAPIRKTSKLAVPKTEIFDDAETAAEAKDLMQRLQDSLATKPKIEKKVEPVQRVAFGYGSSIPNNQFSASHKSNSGYQDKLRFTTKREVKEYKEPWNYYSYYPVTLPLRRPYSGNPDILDNEEFRQVYSFDESMSNPAMGLGLIMEENSEPKMMFFQLPMNMPMTKQASSSNTIEKPAGLEDLQAGIMGKMLVYGSGAVKLKLGDTFYDVGHGSDCVFAQDVVAFNAADKHCSAVGELIKRAIVTPDVNSILEDFADENL